MDSTSIITQASRDEEQLNDFPPETGQCENGAITRWLFYFYFTCLLVIHYAFVEFVRWFSKISNCISKELFKYLYIYCCKLETIQSVKMLRRLIINSFHGNLLDYSIVFTLNYTSNFGWAFNLFDCIHCNSQMPFCNYYNW